MIRMKRHSTTDQILYTGRHGGIKLQLRQIDDPRKAGRQLYAISILRPSSEPLVVWAFMNRGKREELRRAVAAFGGLSVYDVGLKALIQELNTEGSEFIERNTTETS